MTRWRLIVDGPVDGAMNMALDRAVQLSRQAGDSPPTLRLYSWTRPTVSIGRFQDVLTVDLDYCAAQGIDVVRRFTGGRGVLHADELTYSVCAGVEDGIPRGVAASYRHLCAALVASFERLGINASVTSQDGPRSRTSACYLSTTRADLTYGVSKLSGSAQVWFQDTVMQHGSFVIDRDIAVEARAFRLTDEERGSLADSAVSIREIRGERAAATSIIDAVTSGFAEALGIRLVAGEFTAAEFSIAESVMSGTDPMLRHVIRDRHTLGLG